MLGFAGPCGENPMRHRSNGLMAVCLLLAVAGCASVSTTFEGRSVTGKSRMFSYAGLRSGEECVWITLGGKSIKVTTTELSWEGGSMKLPEAWKQMQLYETSDGVCVVVD